MDGPLTRTTMAQKPIGCDAVSGWRRYASGSTATVVTLGG